MRLSSRVSLALLITPVVSGSFIPRGAAFIAPSTPLAKKNSIESTATKRFLYKDEDVVVDTEKTAEAAAAFAASAGMPLSSAEAPTHPNPATLIPFKRIMAANRGEIAVRIFRAATELDLESVSLYGIEDRHSAHRWDSDYSYLLPESGTPGEFEVAQCALSCKHTYSYHLGQLPFFHFSCTSSALVYKYSRHLTVGAYLNITNIIDIAKKAKVEAIHPGYGFLSESAEFAKACADAGITFVGPSVSNLETFGDKIKARQLAIDAGVSVVPGTDRAITSPDDAVAFVEKYGLPVMIKAAKGGGGKGMRVVREHKDLVPFFKAASSEALAAFGDGACFVERYVGAAKHVEVQVIGDGEGQ